MCVCRGGVRERKCVREVGLSGFMNMQDVGAVTMGFAEPAGDVASCVS